MFFKNSASSIAAATSTNKTAPATAGVASGGITAGAGAGACAGGVVNGRDLLVSPMMMDCVKLRNVILEVRSAFNL